MQEPTEELKAALEVVKAEKNARKSEFETELTALCKKYKVNLTNVRVDVLDFDVQIEE